MADYNQQSGYMGQGGQRPVSTYNTAQDEFGFKEGNDYPDQQRGGMQGQGYGAQGYGGQGYSDQLGTGETFQDAPPRGGYGGTDMGVGGPKSAYGESTEGAYGSSTAAYDQPTGDQTQFGVGGKDNYGMEGRDPQLGGTHAGAAGGRDPFASNYDNAQMSNTDSVPAGDGWGAEDTSDTHGAKKAGMMNKIKEKIPGMHNSATGAGGADPDAPPKKGMMEKIKEKLPGHHGSSDPDL